MKICQEKRPFQPIHISFEEEDEARAFFDLIDYIDAKLSFYTSSTTHRIIKELSNARTNFEADI